MNANKESVQSSQFASVRVEETQKSSIASNDKQVQPNAAPQSPLKTQNLNLGSANKQQSPQKSSLKTSQVNQKGSAQSNSSPNSRVSTNETQNKKQANQNQASVQDEDSLNDTMLQDDDKDFWEDTDVKKLFRSKEIKFKLNDQYSDQTSYLNNEDLILKKDFEIQVKDRDGRIILHRAALEQRADVIRNTLDNLDDEKRKEKANEKDNYGNTPIILANIYNNDTEENKKKQSREEIVEKFVKITDLNIQNKNSLFTALHWACIHGLESIVEKLLGSGAFIHIPDKYGYFPIDYAGKFNHGGCVSLLIDYTVNMVLKKQKEVSKMIGEEQYQTQWEKMFDTSPIIDISLIKDQQILMGKDLQQDLKKLQQQYKGQIKIIPLENQYTHNILLFNPILHTSTLYWGCMYKEITVDQVRDILKNLYAYPEGPVMSDNQKSPCHAAAQSGNVEKLDLLMKNIQNRYLYGTAIDKYEASDPNNQKLLRSYNRDPHMCYREKWQLFIKSKRYDPIRKFYTQIFEAKLYQYSRMPYFSMDFQDKFLNTPLHTASQYGNEKCVERLLEEYHLSLTIRNSQGWMPKDLQQHYLVHEAYLRFYKKQHTLFKEREKITSQSANASGRNSFSSTPTGQDIGSFSDPSMMKGFDDDDDLANAKNSITVLQPTVAMRRKYDQDFQNNKPMTEQEIINKRLIASRQIMPQVPPLVLKVNKSQENKQIINGMVNVLQNQGFDVQIFPSLNPDLYYIALNLKQSKLESEAKSIKLKVKLADIDIKVEFEPNQKVKFEPFRTKDIQKIMISLIKKIINVDSLTDEKILIQILPMHDFYGIHEIKQKWETSTKIWLQPSFIKQFYREGIIFEYRELSAIKNYFGEKAGFYYAWMSFYTSWLIIPSIFGFALTIYQIISNVDNIWTSVYSVLVCFWVTIFIERWRRKSAEIALRWGVFDQSSDKEREVRPEFNGDEYFSMINYQVMKLNVQARFYLIIIVSIPVFVILIGICVVVYFLTREFKDQNLNGEINHDRFIQILAGVINGLSISIVNFIYQQLVIIFMKLENHKYADTYEKSFIFKLFAFKFINTNISLFYTAFFDQNFISLYYLIVGMVIQKSLQIFVFKRKYFKEVAKQGQEQQAKHQQFIEELGQNEQISLDKTLISQQIAKQDKLKRAISQFISNPLYKPITDQPLLYQKILYRLVFNGSGRFGDPHLFLDFIELNSVMVQTFEKDEINENSEVFILFGLATLYACACPIVTFYVMLHNIFDIRLDLWCQHTCIRRPVMQVRQDIGPWLAIVEFMALLAVITNSLLLYFSSPTLKGWLSSTFELDTEIYLLWIIVGVEHIIIAMKYIVQVLINDVPAWVKKSADRIENVKDKLMIEQNEREENEKIQVLEQKLREMSQKHKESIRLFSEKVKQFKKTQAMYENKIRQLSNDKISMIEKERELKGVQAIKKLEQEQNQNKKNPEDYKLCHFLGYYETDLKGKKTVAELEKALSRNLKNKLIYLQFNILERDIIGRRTIKLNQTKKLNQINCAQCQTSLATIECTSCQDHYCKPCSDDLHAPSKIVFSLHTLINIPLEVQQRFDILKSVGNQINAKLILSPTSKPQWKKFEYFNFTLDPGNDHYTFIQKHYVYLRQQYITQNYIEQFDKINYQGLFVDKNYDLLPDHHAILMKSRHKRIFGDDELQSQIDRFNDEELMYLNRIAFYLFKHKGENLTFDNYCARLNILQTSPYTRRVTLWLSLIDEKGDEVIPRTTFEKMVNIIFVQDLTQQMSANAIVHLIFGNDKDMTINKLIEIMQKEPVKPFMECIIQFDENEVKDI
ncbi:anoctamin-like protein [Stylonychia lemnae]|uniref:Anoctamin-like protein n=1 Tax=Stylonychia lemnae TaxID=5949 RepID=A0A078APZ6_STYLE|nr:anoctamin-like protein [Stylonychia lemnae]|eukprot:CDW83357.1 anoctamin-like protein [Stylonychia lemnae]